MTHVRGLAISGSFNSLRCQSKPKLKPFVFVLCCWIVDVLCLFLFCFVLNYSYTRRSQSNDRECNEVSIEVSRSQSMDRIRLSSVIEFTQNIVLAIERSIVELLITKAMFKRDRFQMVPI